ncbi:NAD(P)-dependent dehydrogenase (short-subunit alcohol dehydrogenase family)/pimeloyl-ACP methyl ester carboxylesterase [Amycolatopsis lexingtonensis]|uniref:NAD(P)-dependent dehydrogenase (Short-subunit alcohol dehydrogenase family)/pimeloyl-ACP methyl ester carboxylesterase n=1 Tax=Amycolatopsis lexingtonensis TaxID=218822 RepID=A0ABR9IBR4_9PSEU|nr:SDR family oxidoreductase [Amycolatopsis lexingtonensis]MBE1500622.1 NAD(P)-dependent dehydrogenase (short-subunit alcohol dehydrogenase family)/pimeloyl-ACP methyl ester carboxylesterase [Amycolatopsis lexingtonensis]
MSHKWVTASDGVRLSVHIDGRDDGPTVVLVHGYPDNSSMWDGVAAELTAKHRVVTYDVRGAGQSDKPSGRSSYRLDQLADDLRAVVEAVQPAGKVHLVAHDWGSIQTWHAVTGDGLRGRIASYTSISGPSLDHAGSWFRAQLTRPTPKRLKNALSQFLHSWYILAFQLPLIPDVLWRTGLLGKQIQRMEPDAAAPEKSDGRHGLELYRANMFTRLSRPAPKPADVPVQVLAPTGDAYVTTPLQTEVARWVPDLRIRRVVGTHWVTRAKPAVVARAAAELIEYVETGAESRGLRRARVGAGRFEHKLVVVTGAGSGIGRATALAFAAEGADVVITDIDPAAAAETLKLLEDHGVAEYTVDSSDGDAVHRFARDVRENHGVPDIVVNNAGIGMSGPFLDTSVEDWERVIDVNLWGVIHGCRAFAPMLAERAEGGQIVNLASAAAYLPSKILTAYATTKSAVLTLSVCLRAELAEHHIGVTAVCPGIVKTNITNTTTFVGVSEEEQRRRQKESSKLYARRGFGPEGVAKDILRAVEKDTAIAPSTPEAKAALVLSRLAPGLLRAAAKLDLTP